MKPGERPLRHLLAPIQAHLDHPATTEITVTVPGSIGVEQDGTWSYHDVPEFTFGTLEEIAILTAVQSGKNIRFEAPSCTSTFPDGQRVKIVVPPAAAPGTISLTIRKRAKSFTPTLAWLNETGYFEQLTPDIDWPTYFTETVIGANKTTLITGIIGSSKTTFAEALVRAIPHSQRLVTIEGSEEWQDLPHPNWQPYYFDETDPLSATRRVQDAMQSRPDWLPFQELRGSEAWAFLRALKVGTPGISTVHAPNAKAAFASVESMLRQSGHTSNQTAVEITTELRHYVQVVAHCTRTLPKKPGERTRYRLAEVLEVGATPEQDRMVSDRDLQRVA